MIKASCHCGNITLEIPEITDSLTSCNCSICNRLGALWAYYSPGDVAVSWEQAPSVTYSWGDKEIDFHHCSYCGCVTHYSPVKSNRYRLAINARMIEPAIINDIPIRHFDGADSWEYL